ncbi:MAG TPA: TonB family protein [Vicinamibacterales bacterium]|jgi:protein TonB
MFDLITGNARHLPRHAALPIIASTAAQVLVVGSAIAIPILLVTDTMPEIPTMMAFVAVPPPPPPPPPPPAPAQPKPVATRPAPTSVNQAAAPIEPPAALTPERANEGLDVGVPGGVEGGIPGGIVGGVIGGLPEAPPPPPPAVAKAPVRIGGQIQQPALVKRVEPQYPEVAVSAHLQGIVILEAVVGREGMVEEIKVLRSVHPLLDREAELAVRQWRYSPLVLNGTRERFVLTVTLSFHLESVS